ncbi:unnamed protein product [Schistosoma mattheei]|uniref:Uncharacterized protein n=1 Tax=Schistosoma mattheei TaxID=31246 RepID=A0A183NGI8_9TREM|nr:unnamed protein product [Schistosoma mattheei]
MKLSKLGVHGISETRLEQSGQNDNFKTPDIIFCEDESVPHTEEVAPIMSKEGQKMMKSSNSSRYLSAKSFNPIKIYEEEEKPTWKTTAKALKN